MERFLQDDSGIVDCLCGEIIEKLIHIFYFNYVKKENVHNILSLWLKVKHKNFWLRFFIDAGYCFGEKYSLSEFRDTYAEDIESNHSYSLCDRYSLSNTTIVSARVNPINDRGGIKLSFYLDNNQIVSMFCEICDGNTIIALSNLTNR